MAIDNTLAFLEGLPANNCLLYGDRGTGKSSTVKAMLNEFYPRGLRVIEMPKESLMDFPKLVDQIAAIPMKFIIFIDDLSFSKETDTYAALKAVLEGGLAVRPRHRFFGNCFCSGRIYSKWNLRYMRPAARFCRVWIEHILLHLCSTLSGGSKNKRLLCSCAVYRCCPVLGYFQRSTDRIFCYRSINYDCRHLSCVNRYYG